MLSSRVVSNSNTIKCSLLCCVESRGHKLVLSCWNNSNFRENLLHLFFTSIMRYFAYTIGHRQAEKRTKSVLITKISERFESFIRSEIFVISTSTITHSALWLHTSTSNAAQSSGSRARLHNARAWIRTWQRHPFLYKGTL